MQTYYKETPWGKRYSTSIPLIYRIKDGKLELLGLFESRESAEENVAVMKSSPGWQIADVGCIGWGIVGNQVSTNRDPACEPIKVSSEEEAEYLESLARTMHLAVLEYERNNT